MGHSEWTFGLSSLAYDNYVAVNKVLIRSIGLNAAVMVGEVLSVAKYWFERGELDEEGWFFLTVEDAEHNTGLSVHQQQVALKALKEIGVLQVSYRGMPRKRYIRVNARALMTYIDSNSSERKTNSQASENSLASEREIREHAHEKFAVNKSENKSELEEEPSTSVEGEKKTPQRFSPPTEEQVREYGEKSGYIIDAAKFVAHHSANGWMRGKTRMRDWKAAVRYWWMRDNPGRKPGSQTSGVIDEFSQYN